MSILILFTLCQNKLKSLNKNPNYFSDSEASNSDTDQAISLQAEHLMVIGRRPSPWTIASRRWVETENVVCVDVGQSSPDDRRRLLRRLSELPYVRRTFRTPTVRSRSFDQSGRKSRNLSEQSEIAEKRTLPNAKQTNLVLIFLATYPYELKFNSVCS